MFLISLPVDSYYVIFLLLNYLKMLAAHLKGQSHEIKWSFDDSTVYLGTF
jgi:hypothetical protein